ncbi:hypothetical protein [Burkholderia ubonensis]|uniref:hypothetical protein n=1 Tax=Burkholderia ubonensis TaxID=101571 RepID=UPI000758283F|nr:hypothetical protein [Burkholderia ubonensis]KVO83229.1 hypothetical protein WJ82_17225 [Burkholderia ubonensis]
MKLTALRRRMRRLLESVDASTAMASTAAALSDLERQIRMEEMFARAAVRGVSGTLEELAARSAGEHYDVNELSNGDRACRVAELLVRAKQRKLAAEAAR